MSDSVYLELIDFIAGGATPEEVANYRASERAQSSVRELIAREHAQQLTPDEATELHHFLQLEHILRMAKSQRQAHHRRAQILIGSR